MTLWKKNMHGKIIFIQKLLIGHTLENSEQRQSKIITNASLESEIIAFRSR